MSDALTITGGAGGTTAQLAELDAIAAALRAAAAVLDAAASARARLGAVAGPDAAPALAPFDGRRGLLACEQDAHVLGERVRMAKATYADADAESAAQMRGIAVGIGGALGELGPGSLLGLVGVAALVGGLWTRARLERYLPTPQGVLLRWLGSPGIAGRDDWLGALGRTMAGPGVAPPLPVLGREDTELLVQALSAYVFTLAPGRQVYLPSDPVPYAADIVAGIAKARVGDTDLVVVPRTDAQRSDPPTSEADVLEQVADLYPAHDGDPRIDDARVSVQRLDHADGSRSWVVAVPGTEALLSRTNPFDGLSDVQLIGTVPDDATAMVVRAMTQAGIEPGEPVLLAGHSEGGMVAGRIVSDPVLAQRFDVAAVLTAGSPMSAYDIPPSTAALHLEHSQDLVTGLRGLPNPDEVHRTTVLRDLTPSSGPVCWSFLDEGDLHAIDRYVYTAELLPDDDPSVIGFRAAEARVIGPDVVSATTRTFTGFRVPETSQP